MKKIISILVVLLLLSCEPERHSSDFHGIAFSFKESVTIVEVDENVTSFKLEGIFNEDSNDPRNGHGMWLDAFTNPILEFGGFGSIFKIDTVKTTARHGYHYIDKGHDNKFHRVGDDPNTDIYAHIRLIPENIQTEVEIVYYTSKRMVCYEAYAACGNTYNAATAPEFVKNAIDTTIIRLVPKTGSLMERI